MRPKRSAYLLLFILSLLMMTGNAFAQKPRKQKDTLFLYNGERLIGELKQIIRGKVTFDSDVLGVITLKAIRVRDVYTNNGVMRIQTIDRQRHYGQLRPSKSRDTINLLNEANITTELALRDVNSIVAFRSNFWSQLDGNLSAGLSFSNSTSIGQFNFNGTVKHKLPWLETELYVSLLGSIDSSNFSRDQEKEQLTAYHYIKNTPWFAEAALSHQRNVELSLAHRYQGLLGGGNKFITGQAVEAFALTGVAAGSERSIEGAEPAGLQVELPLIVKFDYFKYSQPNLQVTFTNAAYKSLSTSGRYRYDGSIVVSWELFYHFYYTLNLFGNYDSKPLDPGSGKSDYGIVMGITYRF